MNFVVTFNLVGQNIPVNCWLSDLYTINPENLARIKIIITECYVFKDDVIMCWWYKEVVSLEYYIFVLTYHFEMEMTYDIHILYQ